MFGTDVETLMKETSIGEIESLLDEETVLLTFQQTPSDTEYKGSYMHYAAQYLRTDALNYLLRRGCDINGLDTYGYTPVHRALVTHCTNPAKQQKLIEVVKLLGDRGADMTIPTTSGKSPYLMITDNLLQRHIQHYVRWFDVIVPWRMRTLKTKLRQRYIV